MIKLISENLGTIATAAVVLTAVVAIVLRQIKNKKQGKTSCGCGCEGCAMIGSCHPQNVRKQPPAK